MTGWFAVVAVASRPISNAGGVDAPDDEHDHATVPHGGERDDELGREKGEQDAGGGQRRTLAPVGTGLRPRGRYRRRR